MAAVVLGKEEFSAFLAELAKEHALYAPVDVDGRTRFARVSSPDQVRLDGRGSTVPPKELFLPSRETLYELAGDEITDEVPEEPRVVLGIRPCDARALAILDGVFDSKDVKDPYYVARRRNTALVALACNEPRATCFCAAVGGDPFGEDGSDVLLIDLGDAYEMKPLTDKGKELLKGVKGSKPKAGKKAHAAARKKAALEFDLNGVAEKLASMFDSPAWADVSAKCLGCGACSYLCPTCYCFDMTDERTPSGSRKVRTWDCCMFSNFTLHASGHNPRPTNVERFRQKIMHKYSYHPERHGVLACVGCGRCVRNCPAGVDVREVVRALLESEVASK